MKITVIWGITSSSLVDMYQRCRGHRCLSLQCRGEGETTREWGSIFLQNVVTCLENYAAPVLRYSKLEVEL